MKAQTFVAVIALAAAAGATAGYIGGKALVKRLPDQFTFCGVRFTRRMKAAQ